MLSKIESEKLLGLNFGDISQGAQDWLELRRGKITASKANILLVKPKKDQVFSEGQNTYINQLVTENILGIKEQGEYAACQWGKDHEDQARCWYEIETGNEVETPLIIFRDRHMRVACSPDGLVKNKGVEIKCPFNSDNYVDVVARGIDAIDPKYMAQMQFSMFVTGFEFWDFVMFDPRFEGKEIKILTIPMDEKMINIFSEVSEKMIDEIDKRTDLFKGC